MAEPVRNSLLANVKTHIKEPVRLVNATSCLAKIATAVAKDQEFAFESISKEEAEDLEHLANAVLAALKGRGVAVSAKPQLVLRKAKAAEKKMLEDAKNTLRLPMLWRNHIRAIDTEKGPIIVVEPDGLNADSFKEFAALEAEGWRVSVDARFASHFPGHAVCVLLRPPKTALPKPKKEVKKEAKKA